jgi:molybdate transport system regulatory protein
MKAKHQSPMIQPRIRVMRGKDIAMGPGKADLLEEVARAGSIVEAAAELDMSYMRAWTLIKTMERCFKQPLGKVSRGGAKHGGAELTNTGKRVLELYRDMEVESQKATVGTRREMAKLLRS